MTQIFSIHQTSQKTFVQISLGFLNFRKTRKESVRKLFSLLQGPF